MENLHHPQTFLPRTTLASNDGWVIWSAAAVMTIQ